MVSVAFAYDELIPFKNSLNHDDNSSDEDCLKLNVFTPQHEKNTKLPVRQCFTRLPVCLRLNSPKSWLVEILTFVKSMGVGKGGGGGGGEGKAMAPLNFHTLSLKPLKFQKFLHF